MIQKIPDSDGARPGQKGRTPAPTGDEALARQGREGSQDGRGVIEPLDEEQPAQPEDLTEGLPASERVDISDGSPEAAGDSELSAEPEALDGSSPDPDGSEASEIDASVTGADESEAGEAEASEAAGGDAEASEAQGCEPEASDGADAEEPGADDAAEASEQADSALVESAGPVDAPDGDGSREGVPLTLRVESLIFAVAQPVAPVRLARLLEVDVGLIHQSLDLLVARWAERDTAMELVAIAGGYRFMTRPTFHTDLATLSKKAKTDHLSPAALETLSVVAYRQPLCRADIEGIRGVAAGPLLRVLLDRDLIRIAGRSPDPGHPLLYGTTKRFLDHFGLKSLKQLPDIKDLLDVR